MKMMTKCRSVAAIRPQMVLLTAVTSLAALAATASLSHAASDPPGAAVDHAGEQYRLGGQPLSADEAAERLCLSATDEGKVVQCYSSNEALGEAGVQALRAGGLPPGYAAIPPGMTRQELLNAFARQARGELPTRPDGIRAASVRNASVTPRRRKTQKLHAQAADGYTCGLSYTYVYTNASFGGSAGTEGYTGVGGWLNFSATFDNKVSSFWAADWFTSRWHDYANGGGAYYGNGFACRWVENLGNASMTDGGTANDRFSSFGNW